MMCDCRECNETQEESERGMDMVHDREALERCIVNWAKGNGDRVVAKLSIGYFITDYDLPKLAAHIIDRGWTRGVSVEDALKAIRGCRELRAALHFGMPDDVTESTIHEALVRDIRALTKDPE